MSQRTATITSLPMAFEIVKAMQAEGLDWGEGYRPLGRQALHAYLLTLEHPRSGELLHWEANLPEDLLLLKGALEAAQ